MEKYVVMSVLYFMLGFVVQSCKDQARGGQSDCNGP